MRIVSWQTGSHWKFGTVGESRCLWRLVVGYTFVTAF